MDSTLLEILAHIGIRPDVASAICEDAPPVVVPSPPAASLIAGWLRHPTPGWMKAQGCQWLLDRPIPLPEELTLCMESKCGAGLIPSSPYCAEHSLKAWRKVRTLVRSAA